MKIIKNMRIKYKLVFSFLFVSIFVAVAGLFGMQGIFTIKSTSDVIYRENMNLMRKLDMLHDNLLETNESLLKILNERNSENLSSTKKLLDQNKIENQQIINEFNESNLSPEEKKLYLTLVGQLGSYQTKSDEFINLVEKNNYDQAHEDYMNLMSLNDSLINSLNSLIEFNLNEAKQADDRNDNIFGKIMWGMVILTVLCVLSALRIGSRISRYISNQIKKDLEFAEQLAQGNLEHIINVDTKDELGTLGIALNKAAENTLSLMEELKCSEEELRQQVDELQTLGEKLTTSEERYRLAINGANDGLWDIDLKTRNIFVSDKCKDILEIEDWGNNFEVNYWTKMIHSEEAKTFDDMFYNHLNKETGFYYNEFTFVTSSGVTKHIMSRGKVRVDYLGNPARMCGSLTDITDRKLAEERIRFLAYFDTLTGLHNRSYIVEKLPGILEKIHSGEKGALFFLDLDNFKKINDTLGHEAGDDLIRQASQMFKECMGERSLVCRLAGDEFIIFIPSIESVSIIKSKAEELIDIFRRPLEVNKKTIFITGSVGVAVYPDDGTDVQTLFKNADTAMYYAKSNGKNNYMMFTREMQATLLEKMELENSLRHAIHNEEFILYYQPKISAISGKMEGMEALVRWVTKDNNMISPAKFIPIAEETGLIIPLGEFVLRTACKQNKAWQDKGYKPLRVSVNFSMKQLKQHNLIEMIKDILEETGLEAQWLEVEITETILVENMEFAINVLRGLHELGIKVSLDDFGTGYSSLNYLRKLPIHSIKIDKSFVDDIAANNKEKIIASSLIELAHGMSLKVVAEGVESVQQYNLLKGYSCDEIQGFLFSKPLPVHEFETIMNKENFIEYSI